jgi:hypothetical protein
MKHGIIDSGFAKGHEDIERGYLNASLPVRAFFNLSINANGILAC